MSDTPASPPYYVSTRYVAKGDSHATQLLFELRGPGNSLIDIPSSDGVPVCHLHIPLDSLPGETLPTHILPATTPALSSSFVLDSNGAFTFEIYHSSTDSQTTDEYFTAFVSRYMCMIALALARYLNLPLLDDQEGVEAAKGLGRFNLAKMFAQRVLGLAAPSPEFMGDVEWPRFVPANSSITPKRIQVSVPSYALVRGLGGGWFEWNLVSRQIPISQVTVTSREAGPSRGKPPGGLSDAKTQTDRPETPLIEANSYRFLPFYNFREMEINWVMQ